MRTFSNTAISLDGRINTREGRFTTLGSPRDLQRMSELRAQADAVLVGGATFRNWPHAALPEAAHLPASPPTGSPPCWNVVVSRSLDVPLLPAFLQEPRVCPLFLTRSAAIPAGFPAEVEGYAGPGPDLPVPWMLEALARRGVRSLLVEAGGDLLFQFLAADALDELYVTLCPLLIGGKGVPSLADGSGFGLAELRRLHLLDPRRKGVVGVRLGAARKRSVLRGPSREGEFNAPAGQESSNQPSRLSCAQAGALRPPNADALGAEGGAC